MYLHVGIMSLVPITWNAQDHFNVLDCGTRQVKRVLDTVNQMVWDAFKQKVCIWHLWQHQGAAAAALKAAQICWDLWNSWKWIQVLDLFGAAKAKHLVRYRSFNLFSHDAVIDRSQTLLFWWTPILVPRMLPAASSAARLYYDNCKVTLACVESG